MSTVSLLAVATTVLGSTVVGSLITWASQVVATRRSDRQAEQGRARELLTQVVTAATALEAGRAVFRERRYGWRPTVVRAGHAMLLAAAAARDGNWLRGAADGIAGMRDWDAGEETRFIERLTAASAQITPALVQLALLSPAIADAAVQVSEAIAAGSHARRQAEVTAAGQALLDAVASLRAAVIAFTTPPRRARLGRQRAATRQPVTSSRHGDRDHHAVGRGQPRQQNPPRPGGGLV